MGATEDAVTVAVTQGSTTVISVGQVLHLVGAALMHLSDQI